MSAVSGFPFTIGLTGDGCQAFGIGWINEGGVDLFAVGWNRNNGCEVFAVGWPYNPAAPFVPVPPDEVVHPMGSPRRVNRRILRDDDEIVFATIVAFMEIRDRWH